MIRELLMQILLTQANVLCISVYGKLNKKSITDYYKIKLSLIIVREAHAETIKNN